MPIRQSIQLPHISIYIGAKPAACKAFGAFGEPDWLHGGMRVVVSASTFTGAGSRSGAGAGCWPAQPHPRDKIVHGDPGALSDQDLLAVLLGSGGRGLSSAEIAQTLLARFGSLRGVANAELIEWQCVQGVGLVRYAELKAAAEFGRRCLAENIVRDGPLESPGAAGDYLRALLRDRGREVFGCLFLDTRHRVMNFEELFVGTIDGAVVHPREVVRIALLRNAAAVIAVHNHPSGVAEPSQADIALTHRLREALEVVDVRLLDHLVIGDDQTVSLSRRGHM